MNSTIPSLMTVGVIMPTVVNPISVAIDRLRAIDVKNAYRPFAGLPFNVQKGLCKSIVIFPLKDLLAKQDMDSGLAGGLAGAAQIYLTGPLETKFSRAAIRGFASLNGIRDAYSGALTNSVKAFIYWGVFFKATDLSWQYFEKENAKRDWAIGGFSAAAVCSPLSVLVTNRQVSSMKIKTIAQTMFAQRGLWGFYRPLGLEIARSVIAGIGTRMILDQFDKSLL